MEGAIEFVDRLISLHLIGLRRRDELILPARADAFVGGLVAVGRNNNHILRIDSASPERGELALRSLSRRWPTTPRTANSPRSGLAESIRRT